MATALRQSFVMEGADGGELRGDVRASRAAAGGPAVVICHGFKGFKDWGFFPHLADRLARAGMTAVSFNFSGSGIGPDGERFSEPERFAHATFSNDVADLRSVWKALETGSLLAGVEAPSRLGLFGHSRGGGVAVLFAGECADVSALVTWAPIGSTMRWGPETLRRWRAAGKLDVTNSRTGEVLPLYTDVLDDLDRNGPQLDIPAAAGRVEAPWLIVHGESDETVPVADGYRLAESGKGTLQTVPRASHTFGARHPWAGSTPQLDQAMEATVAWFVRYLF